MSSRLPSPPKNESQFSKKYSAAFLSLNLSKDTISIVVMEYFEQKLVLTRTGKYLFVLFINGDFLTHFEHRNSFNWLLLFGHRAIGSEPVKLMNSPVDS